MRQRRAGAEFALRKYQEGARDAHRNPVDAWGAPVSRKAWAFAPGTPEEAQEPNRTPSTQIWTVYGPVDALEDIRPKDKVDYQGQTFDVDGSPAVWDNQVYGVGVVGATIMLRRVEG